MRRIDLGSPYLEAHVDGRALRVRIDRAAKRNAFTQDMYRGLKRAAILADGDAEIDALCIRGSGDVFAVGGDMSGENTDPEGLAQELDHTEHFPFRHLEQCSKIVVTAVNGLCHAGGVDLVLFSDLAIASEKARFRLPELLRGVPDPWVAARLAERVGTGRAKYLFFTAAEIDARQAAAMRLVTAVVAHDRLDRDVEELLEQISRTAPRARAAVKDDMNRRLPSPDVNLFRRSLLSAEMVEGLQAFLDKRAPRWPR
jgi:enoyl-CoA hydratase/carnithine racemase